MKFPEPRTFRGATSPVTVVRWALGIGTLEYPTGRPRRFMSLCWSGTILILLFYCVSLAALKDVWDLEKSTLTKTTYQIYVIAIAVSGITFVYLGQVRSKSVVHSLCKLDKVNEMLNKIGIPKEYGSTFKSQIIHLIGTLLFLLTMTLYPIVYAYGVFNEVPIALISSTIGGQYTVVVSFLEDYTFSSCIRYIGKRLRHLNTYLGQLSIKDGNAKLFLQDLDDHIPWLPSMVLEDHVQSRRVANANKQWMMRILQNAKNIHHDLCNTAKNLNETFNVHILLSMAMALGTIITMLYNTYYLIVLRTTAAAGIEFRIMSNLIWVGFYATKVFYIISACSMTSNEAHQTGDRIHELVNPITCNEIREEIHAFSLQLMQDPLQFTACGFFDLDNTMIRAMVGTITTYLVFMIQMPHTVSTSTTNATFPAVNSTI